MIKIILAALFLFNAGFAQDNAQQIIKAAQDRYDGITDLTADFKQTASTKNSSSGKFFFKKKNKIRIELSNHTIITDGTTNWNFNKKENKVIISAYDDSDPFALSLNKLVYDYPANCNIKDISKDGQKILYLTPKNSSISFKSITIWIDDDNLISKVELEESSAGKMEVKFSGYKINTNLSDSKFSFNAPEGSSIIDLR